MAKRPLENLCIVLAGEAGDLARLLERGGYGNVVRAPARSELLAVCADVQPDLVIIGVGPSADGVAELRQLAAWAPEAPRMPIMVAVGEGADGEVGRRALDAGAADVVGPPVDDSMAPRIERLLDIRRLEVTVAAQRKILAERELEHRAALEAGHLETLERVAAVAEYRDDNTREHTLRVGRTARLLAPGLGLPEDVVAMIGAAAALHDIGKVAIPDTILLKPGRLSDEEYEVAKSHVEIGARILSGSASPLVRLSEEIVLSHHERWDGGGYPAGRSAEEIPLTGRIVAVADVFDILVHERPYKDSWTVDEALAEIRRTAGRQFDPRVVEAFEGLDTRQLIVPVHRVRARTPRLGS